MHCAFTFSGHLQETNFFFSLRVFLGTKNNDFSLWYDTIFSLFYFIVFFHVFFTLYHYYCTFKSVTWPDRPLQKRSFHKRTMTHNYSVSRSYMRHYAASAHHIQSLRVCNLAWRVLALRRVRVASDRSATTNRFSLSRLGYYLVKNNIKMFWLVAKCKTYTFKHCLMSCGSWVMLYRALKRNIKWHASQEPQYIKQYFKVQVLHFANTQKIEKLLVTNPLI